MKLVFASDHAGFELRGQLAEWAIAQGHEVVQVGAPSLESYDYPDAADLACNLILAGEADFGIFICGSGVGINIRANRHPGIRCAHVEDIERAKLAREHNNANGIALGARFIGFEHAAKVVDAFIHTSLDSGERHANRVKKLDLPC
jgi:ribose 5-phosphate isomerase B